MPESDKDKKQDFEDAHDQASSFWSPYIIEANRDIEFVLGRQFSQDRLNYLSQQRREGFEINKLKRIIRLLSGYQRKNRLSLKMDPVEGSDEKTADQLTGVAMWVMQYCNGYPLMSDTFDHGALQAGINFIEIYIDRSDDLLSGDIKLARKPYNRILLDPHFTNRDMTDCNYALARDYLSMDVMKSLLPANRHKMLKDIKPGLDGKYSYFYKEADRKGKELFAYDRFWHREREQYTLLLDPQSSEQHVWEGDKTRLGLLLNEYPQLKVLKGFRNKMVLDILVEGHPVFNGPDPTGLNDYPLVPVMGFYTPEYKEAKYKLQGLVRGGRDPQTLSNKLVNQMVDIIESQINSGWETYEGVMVDDKMLYQSGQGQAMVKKAESFAKYQGNELKKTRAAEIPQSFFQLYDILNKAPEDVLAVNSEMFGSVENDIQVAGVLAKLREGQGLTANQDLLDNYRLSKKMLGMKMVKMIQENFKPDKIQRIINEQPSQEFYNKKFGKYDCVPTEGLLTDTQRQMYYAQLMAMKEAGLPIPDAAIIDAAPIQGKEDLKKAIEAESQATQQANAKALEQQQQMQQLQIALLMSELKKNEASTAEKGTQAKENMSNAVLDRAKTFKELQGMDVSQFTELMKLIQSLRMDQQATTGQTGNA